MSKRLWQRRQNNRRLEESALATAEGFSRQRSVRKLIALYEKTLAQYALNGQARREESGWEGIQDRLEVEWRLFIAKIEAIDATINEALTRK